MAMANWRGNKNSKFNNNSGDGNGSSNAGYSGGASGETGDYHGGGPSLTKLMLQCQKAVSSTLKWGKFSDKAVSQSIKIIEGYKHLIDARLSKSVKPDTEAVNVTVEAKAVATGDAAQVDAHVKLGVFDIDNSVKLVIGSAESYAATGDKAGDTYVNSFAGVKGVDTGEITSFYHKGANFEKAVECLVAIDWESVYDKNWVFSNHHSFYSKMKKDVGAGQKIKASTDVHVEANTEAQVHSGVEALAVDDTIKAIATADAIAT
jgi:hypothetical protein